MAATIRKRYSLAGIELPIFNLPALVDQKRVFVCEGEKAALRLAQIGLAATCPPAGASSWQRRWSSQIWRSGAYDVSILADNDQAGDQHAERVAAALSGYGELPSLPPEAEAPWASWPMAGAGDPEIAPLRVKVIRVPDLPKGGDVVDYLDLGHKREDSWALVEATPWWGPRLLESERLARRRAQTRDRVRRHRVRRAQLRVTQRVQEERASCNTDSQRYALHEGSQG